MEIQHWSYGGADIPIVVHDGVIYAEHNQVAGGLKLHPRSLLYMAENRPERFSQLNGIPDSVKRFFSDNKETFGRKRIRRIWIEDDIINFAALGRSEVCAEFQRSFVRFIKQVARRGCVTREELQQIVQKNNEQLLVVISELREQVKCQGDTIEAQRQVLSESYVQSREAAEVMQEDLSSSAKNLQRGSRTKDFRKSMGLTN